MDKTTTMPIVGLKVVNFKRIKAVEMALNPDGLTFIGGRNGQGKSSVLDAVCAALGGARWTPVVPIRQGETSGSVELDLGALKIKRTFTAKGGTLTVKRANGDAVASPKEFLDTLTGGNLAFDPFEFSRLKPSEQAAALRAIAGIDTTEMDNLRQSTFEERTNVNRDAKAAKARADAKPYDPALPCEPRDTAAIIEQLTNIDAQRREAQKIKDDADALAAKARSERAVSSMHEAQAADKRARAERLMAEAAALEAEAEKHLKNAEINATSADTTKEQAEKRSEEYTAVMATIPSASDLTARLNEANSMNARITANADAKKLHDEAAALAKKGSSLTAKIERMDADKARLLAEAKYPIDGLAINTDGTVIYNGVPLEQASASERLKVGVAVGLAGAPSIRVLLVRDGSLLDADSRKVLADMARDANAQILVEIVGKSEEIPFIIEDGELEVSE